MQPHAERVHYRACADGYVLCSGVRAIATPIRDVAFCFDRVDGSIYCHGDTTAVHGWADRTRASLRLSGFDIVARSIVVMDCHLPVAEINRMLHRFGYVRERYLSELVLPERWHDETVATEDEDEDDDEFLDLSLRP